MGRFSPAKGDYATVILRLSAWDVAKLRLRPDKMLEEGGIFLFFFTFFSIFRGFLPGKTANS